MSHRTLKLNKVELILDDDNNVRVDHFAWGVTKTTKGDVILDETSKASVLESQKKRTTQRYAVDIDHMMDSDKKVGKSLDERRAYGWGEVGFDDVGMFSMVRFTDSAIQLINDGGYLYTSPVIAVDDDNRIMEFIRFSLVNDPATYDLDPLVKLSQEKETKNMEDELEVTEEKTFDPLTDDRIKAVIESDSTSVADLPIETLVGFVEAVLEHKLLDKVEEKLANEPIADTQKASEEDDEDKPSEKEDESLSTKLSQANERIKELENKLTLSQHQAECDRLVGLKHITPAFAKRVMSLDSKSREVMLSEAENGEVKYLSQAPFKKPVTPEDKPKTVQFKRTTVRL